VVAVFALDGKFPPFLPPACDCLREGCVNVCACVEGMLIPFRKHGVVIPVAISCRWELMMLLLLEKQQGR